MTAVMTLTEAEALAGRVLGYLDRFDLGYMSFTTRVAQAGQEQVKSDLEGLRWHLGTECSCCEGVCGCDSHLHEHMRCPDARRYVEGLLRTAALFGVTR